jgi:RNA polymerase sigma-70 factor (ECF subfamily)
MDDDLDHEYVQLLVEHQQLLRAFVISLLPGASGVDDVIQETNTVLWRKRTNFEPATNFRAWALKIARFQVMSHRHRLVRQRREVFDDELLNQLAQESGEMIDHGIYEERSTALQKCLSKLGEKDRDMLLRRYWKRQPLQDFAVLQGISLSNLKVRLFRLRSALKHCIERELTCNEGGAA